MISNPKAGWCDFKIGTFESSSSCLKCASQKSH